MDAGDHIAPRRRRLPWWNGILFLATLGTTVLSGAGFAGYTGDVAFDVRGEPVRNLFFLTVDKGDIREMRSEELGGAPVTAP